MGTSTMLRMTVLRMDITGRIGLMAACLSVLGRGFMGMAASTDTWITGMTLAMGTTGLCRDVGQSSSTTSRAMRLGMGAGMSDMPATTLVGSVRCRDTVAAGVGVGAGR